MRRSLKVGGIVVLGLVVLVAVGVGLGALGVPAVTGVENSFGPVNDTNTVVHTDVHVNNPNPIGVRLGGVSVNYSVAMNDVDVASGQQAGLGISSGDSTVNLTTAMDNGQIPAWWYTHVRNGESTTVQIDATATSSTLGRSASFGRNRGVETDIASQFDSNETRAVDADQPFVSDPVLYINGTRGSWDRENLTRERTPLDLDFTVFNPKSVPYTVSKIGYNITMNGVPVGAGETDSGYVIEPRTTETVRANTAIRNAHLDEWWVTHLERNQETELYVDFHLIVEIGGERIRVDLDAIDYEKRIETDIFGNKPTGEGSNATDSSGAETATTTATATEDSLLGETTDGSTAGETTNGNSLDHTTETDDPRTDEPTTTATETDGGGIVDGGSGTDDDGVL